MERGVNPNGGDEGQEEGMLTGNGRGTERPLGKEERIRGQWS